MKSRRNTQFRPSLGLLEPRQLLTGPSTMVAPVAVVNYKVVTLTHPNKFQDNVLAIAVGGSYTRSFTLGVGTVHKVGDLFHQTLPATAGPAYVITSKIPLKPGDTVGQFRFSQVAAWYNNVPVIKGLNYTIQGSMNLTLFNKVKEGDLLRWVPNANRSMANSWRTEASLTETDKLLVSEIGNNADGSSSLPNLRSGTITNLSPSSDLYNCYAYSAENGNPTSIGWVAGNEGAPDGANKVYSIKSLPDLIALYKQHGWNVVSSGPTQPAVPKTGQVAIYLNANGAATHAALSTQGAVYAKMGRLGTFRFSSLNQMSGGAFGTPSIWLQRAP